MWGVKGKKRLLFFPTAAGTLNVICIPRVLLRFPFLFFFLLPLGGLESGRGFPNLPIASPLRAARCLGCRRETGRSSNRGSRGRCHRNVAQGQSMTSPFFFFFPYWGMGIVRVRILPRKKKKSVKIWASGGDLSTWRIPTPLVDTATLFLRETIPYLHIYQSDYLPLPRCLRVRGWLWGVS